MHTGRQRWSWSVLRGQPPPCHAPGDLHWVRSWWSSHYFKCIIFTELSLHPRSSLQNSTLNKGERKGLPCRINKKKVKPRCTEMLTSPGHSPTPTSRVHVHSRLSCPAVFMLVSVHPQPESRTLHGSSSSSPLSVMCTWNLRTRHPAQPTTGPLHIQFSCLNTVLVLLSFPTCPSSSGECCFSWGGGSQGKGCFLGKPPLSPLPPRAGPRLPASSPTIS